MIFVDQTIVDAERGNCMQAVVASLLDLELEQVPNFVLFKKNLWFDIYYYFLYAMGWDCIGYKKFKGNRNALRIEDGINGLFDASVKSRTFKNKTHAVIIDIKGVVVHDPNPLKTWLGVNVFETSELQGWLTFKPRPGAQ